MFFKKQSLNTSTLNENIKNVKYIVMRDEILFL